MRFAVCLTLCLFIASSLAQLTPNEDTLQQMYNGFSEQAGLADPTTIITSCYDDNSATITNNFIAKILQQLDNYDVFDIQSTVNTFESQLPQSVKDCTNANAEYQNIQKAYGMAGLTMAQLTSKVGSYAFAHLSQLHSQADTANTAYKAGNYNQVGKQGGVLAQSIFASEIAAPKVRSAQDNLQQLTNGFWEQAGLQDPTTVSSCFDEPSANLTVNFIGNLLNDLANSNIKAAEAALQAFETNLPQPVKDCLNGNAEMQQVLQAYNMFGLTINQIQTKIESYALFHLLQLHHDATIANSDFQAGNYKAVGQEGGSMIQNVFGKNTTVAVLHTIGTQQANLQLLANGLWEQGKLADPTSIVTCFDEPSANLTIVYVGLILQYVANSNLPKAEAAATYFSQNLPKTVQDCVKNSSEVQPLLQAYGIAGLSKTQIENKLKSYVLLHILQLHHFAVIANSDFQAGNYKQVGQELGTAVQAIFGQSFEDELRSNQDEVSDTDYEAILQQYFNGFFEQVNLTDPTTILPDCYVEETAQIVDTAIANIIDDLANKKILAAEGAANTLLTELPASVRQCVANNAEYQKAAEAYGITSVTPTQMIEKVVAYAFSHSADLVQMNQQADEAIKAQNYNQAGKILGQALQAILAAKVLIPKEDPLQELGELFDGFWEQAGQPDPTTAIACFDETNAQIAINLASQLFEDLANDDFLDIPSAIKLFQSQISPTVMSCVSSDPEVAAVGQAYGISGMSTTLLVAKGAKYALLHAAQFHGTATQIEADYEASQYNTVGKLSGQLLQAMLADKKFYNM